MSAVMDDDYGFTSAQDYQTDKVSYDEYGFTSAIPDQSSYQQKPQEEQPQSAPEYISLKKFLAGSQCLDWREENL